MATIQGIYLALFGRPADPGGLAYWNGVTNNGQDLSKLMGQLTSSPEFTARFTGQTNTQIVTAIYQSLFGRAPDAAGLEFFTSGLSNGTLKLESIAINILDGARDSDKTVVENKVVAADLFTKSLDTQAEIDAYKGDAAAALGRSFVAGVTSDPATIPSQTQVDAAVTTVVTSGGQAPGGGDAGGGDVGGEAPDPIIAAINGATSATSILTLFSANEAKLFETAALTLFDEMPAGQGRQQAVALGVAEHIRLFGPFTDVASIKEVISYHTGIEHSKFVFINAVDGADDLASMITALQLGDGLSSDRQSLIAEWLVSGDADAVTRAGELIVDTYTTVLNALAGASDLDLIPIAQMVLDARGSGSFFGVGNIITALNNALSAENVMSLDNLINDRTAPGDVQPTDHDLAITIDPSGPGINVFHRYQGVKPAENAAGTDYYDLSSGAVFSTDFKIESEWAGDHKGQASGVWVQMQDIANKLPGGGGFSMVEYLDGEGADLLRAEPARATDNIAADFTGGFRFWNSDTGWTKYLNYSVSEDTEVRLTFVFTDKAHIWYLDDVEVYRDDDQDTLDAVNSLETVIFNSINFGEEETYNYSNISLVGTPVDLG